MKTTSVSLLAAGWLLPAIAAAEPAAKPSGEEGKDGRRGMFRNFHEAWQRADADGDGAISPQEFAATERVAQLPAEKRDHLFRRLDKNADGRLSRDELARDKRRGDGPHRRRLWELDVDKSGGITLDEFKAGPMFSKLPPQKQENIFRRLDTDGDGAITPQDKPEPPGRRDGKDEGPLNRRLDTDGDGALSFEEFRAGPAMQGLSEDQQEDRFELLDRNKDLKLTPEDFPRGGEEQPRPAPSAGE